MHSLRGIPLSDFRWPGGDFRDAGTLRLTPEDVEHKLGFSFERGVDDLDYYRALGLELPSGRRVVLNWYERAPEPRHLAVWADATDDLVLALSETLTGLGLPASAIAWQPAPN